MHNLPYLLIYCPMSCLISCGHQYFLQAKLAGSRGKSQPDGDMMGFGSDFYQVLWLGFVQQELPESLSSIARFSGNTDRVFSSITDLIHGSIEEEK